MSKQSSYMQAAILADYLFTFTARVALENAEVLTELVKLIDAGADGEERQDEPLTANLLRAVASRVVLIRDEPVVGYPEGEGPYDDHKYCRDCRECVMCGLRPCFNGMNHTPE